MLSLLVVLANFGLDTWLLASSRTFASHVAQLWPLVVRARFGLLLLWLVGIAGLSQLLPRDAFPRDVVYVTAVGLAFDSLSLLAYSALRSLERHKRVTILQIGASLALLGVTLILPLQSGQLIWFATARTLVSMSAAGAVLLAVGVRSGQIAPLIGLRDLFRSARPFVLADVAVAVYLKADLSIIGLILGGGGAGVYGPALNLINITFMVPNALYFFIVPRLSHVHNVPGRSFRRIGLAQLLAQGLVGAVLSVSVFTSAPMLIQLVFGSAYALSASVLQLLSPIPFLKSLNFGLGAMLTAGDLQQQRTAMQVLCAIFNVTTDLIVIGPLGVGGVALTYTASELLLFLGYAATVRHRQLQQRGA